jgi:hypothetical protein
MNTNAKLLLSVLVAAIAIGFLFVSSAGSPSWWRGGSSDSMRRTLFRDDGTPKKFTKPVFLALCVVAIIVLWRLVP